MLTPDQIERLVTAAVGLADAKARRHDREPTVCCDSILPGEYAASPQPPAGTPTGPRNPDGGFDEPVQRPVWMSPSDPRDGVTYQLAHAADGSLALIGVDDPAADGPTVFYDSAPKGVYLGSMGPDTAVYLHEPDPSPSAPTPPTA